MDKPKCAIWARVSTTDQHTENQLDVLREMAAGRGFDPVREFITEDSAWAGNGNGSKGKEFDKAREAMLEGARRGEYRIVLVWALDRLSRRGYDDLNPVLKRLRTYDCELISHQESFIATLGPFGEVVIHMLALMAEQESQRRSERIKAGLARRRRDIEAGKIEGTIGGSKKGRKLKKGAGVAGAQARWADPAQREALAQRNRQRAGTA